MRGKTASRLWSFPGLLPGAARRARRRLLALGAGLALLLLAGACGGGAYPVDIFQEMHYQQSYRVQEPPRLHAGEEAVPVTGKSITAVGLPYGQARELTPPPDTEEAIRKGEALFQVNCSMCHGLRGDGAGTVASYFETAGVPAPYDFTGTPAAGRTTSAIARFATPGEVFWVITNGGFINMPQFGPLLTEEERWALVHYIRSLAPPAGQ